MAEHDSQPSKAEQRQLAVEKLRRAASLPRMKDGRRPPMHVEAVSEGEKPSSLIPDEKKPSSQSSPLVDISPPQESATEPEPEPEQEPADPEPDQDIEERTVSPNPTGRSKRRSRSRSRSRGSRDFKNKARNAQSPIPPAGDSSQDDEEPPIPLPPTALPVVPTLLAPLPGHLSPFQNSHFLRSPTPDPSMFYPGFSPPSSCLPSLEALQRGLFRSHSVTNAAAGRREALAKLTGGVDIYDPSPSASPTPPSLSNGGGLSRNNTVAGGERIAARQLMLNRLNGRIAKEAEAEASGSEEKGAPTLTPKKRRRRSRGNSLRAAVTVGGVSDSDNGTVSTDTPHPFDPRPPDPSVELRIQSRTPVQTSSRDQSTECLAETQPGMISAADAVNQGPLGHARRRSILVEEEEDEDENVHTDVDEDEQQERVGDEDEQSPQQLPPQYGHRGTPATPPRFGPHVILPLAPPSGPPTLDNIEPGIPLGVPFFLGRRTPSRNDVFPMSPFNSPLKEGTTEEDEVIYGHNNYRVRTPFSDIHTDGHGREISWIGDPVPIMVEEESDDDEDGVENTEEDDRPPPAAAIEEPVDEQGAFEEPLSPTSSEAPRKDGSFSPHPSSQSIVVETEIPAQTSTPSSGAPISTSQSIDEARVSPQPQPTRLSINSRHPSGNDKLLPPGDEYNDQSISNKRIANGDHTSPSTWDKLKGAFSRANPSGRRSRSNSLAARERRDNVDLVSSVNRESGASLTNAKTDKLSEGQPQPLQAPPLMQTPSASASIISLSPHTHVPPRDGASPIPPATSADFAKYRNAKLFPFPGIQKLEEQRNRVRATGAASYSSPDVSNIVDEDQVPPSAHSYNNIRALTPDVSRERTLSHQTSDSRLFARPNGGIPISPPFILTPSNSQGEYIDVAPSPSSSHNGKISKLPMTLPGVKQWLHNKKLFSSSSSNSPPSQISGIIATAGNNGVETVGNERSKNGNKKPSLSDLLRKRGSDVAGDWEEVGTTPISVEGGFSFLSSSSQPSTPATMTTVIPAKAVPLSSSSSDSSDKIPLHDQTNKSTVHTDMERTPKAKKLTPLDLHKSTYSHADDSPSPSSNLLSRSDPLLSSTPDPTSSLSDYPPHSTSESSSESSRYSIAPQGSQVLDRIEENLLRGSKNPPFLASIIDDPPRKSVFTWPVYQVVNQKTVKDRFLFLFNDLLVIAKPRLSPHENLVEFKASSLDRQFTVKNVVLLKDIRFTPGRTDTPKSPSQKDQQSIRSAAIKGFVAQFMVDPEAALKALVAKNKVLEDSRRLGQFIFQTVELDRARVGEYLSKKLHKPELDAYLNCFGFVGVRVDKALRAFLMSVNVPVHNSSALDNLLDGFAGRWYDANSRFVAFDKNMATRLARALVRLNMILHADLAEAPGPTGYPVDDFPVQVWVDQLRRADPRQLLSTDLLEELYDSIRQEKLCQARSFSAGGPPTQLITIRKAVPSRLTYKSQSDPIILRISAPDSHLTIHLDGHDLQFDPPVLHFVKSSEASFRIIGTELGLKTMIMRRSGPNALKYTGLPLSNTLVVERAFMRNTFQIAFTDHREMKRRYMFSVADPVWAFNVRTSIEQASSSSPSSNASPSTEAPKFLRIAEQAAFNVLQRSLIDGPESIRLNGSPAQNTDTSSLKPHKNGKPGGFRHVRHVRSKSRSQLYRDDAGQNELDLSYDSSCYSEFRDSDLSDINDEGEEQTGPVWSGEELLNVCQQNSTIPFVLSLLQVGVLGKEAVTPS